jgi:hypothetical protein
MAIIELLKRKDAASVMVAVIGALVIVQFLSTILAEPAAFLSGVNHSIIVNGSFKEHYILPLVTFTLDFLGLELLIRGYVAVSSWVNKR